MLNLKEKTLIRRERTDIGTSTKEERPKLSREADKIKKQLLIRMKRGKTEAMKHFPTIGIYPEIATFKLESPSFLILTWVGELYR